MIKSLGKTDGRDSYCRAEHLTGLLGGADRNFNLFLHPRCFAFWNSGRLFAAAPHTSIPHASLVWTDLIFTFSCVVINMFLPASTCVSAHQLQHFSHIAHGSICDDEDLARVHALHGLLVEPSERPQQVGSSHVSSHPLDVLIGLY